VLTLSVHGHTSNHYQGLCDSQHISTSFQTPALLDMYLQGNKSWKLFQLICAAYFLSGVDAHGIMSQPRQRGALRTQRNLVPQVMDPNAPIDYCPHCQNCGGVGMVSAGGPWKMYSPFQYKRAGLTMCGDPVGKNEHTSKGIFANPPSMPFAATYAAGSVANFECSFLKMHNPLIHLVTVPSSVCLFPIPQNR
jgi:hypothetical protein